MLLRLGIYLVIWIIYPTSSNYLSNVVYYKFYFISNVPVADVNIELTASIKKQEKKSAMTDDIRILKRVCTGEFLFGPHLLCYTRVLWNTYPVHCLLHEIMWYSAHSWRRLQVRQNTYFCMHCWQWWLHCVQSSIYEYGPVELTAPCSSWAFAKCKHTYNEPGRDVTWTALVISVYSVWDVTWTAINALVISSDLCSVWQFHIFHIAMTGSSLLSSCSVFLPN